MDTIRNAELIVTSICTAQLSSKVSAHFYRVSRLLWWQRWRHLPERPQRHLFQHGRPRLWMSGRGEGKQKISAGTRLRRRHGAYRWDVTDERNYVTI